MPLGRTDGTGTIVNDDMNLESVAPNVLPNTGPVTVTLRGQGLTSRMSAKSATPAPNGWWTPSSFTPSDDGLTAKVVFDTTGLQMSTGTWYVQLYTHTDPNFQYRDVSIVASAEGAKPYVQAVVAPTARGGLVSYDYLHYGNAGMAPSQPAFLRLSGYPAGADVVVDHLPAGASYTLADSVAGRTVLVSLGKIAGGASDYVRVAYTPSTTIAGHTILNVQPSMTFGAEVPAQTDLRTFAAATPIALGPGERFASNLTFSPSGSLTLRFAQTAATGAAPAVTHAGNRWTFSTDIVDTASPEPAKAARAAKRDDPTRGLVTVDFNGGTFKISGPIQETEGAYEVSIERKRLTACMRQFNIIDEQEFNRLNDLAEGAVVLKGLANVAKLASAGSDTALQVMDVVMTGAWERAVAGGHFGDLDRIANTQLGFDEFQEDEYQILWLAQLCNPDHGKPDPNANWRAVPARKEVFQSRDPNEKYGTQGGGDRHAVRSDRPLDYVVGFQNLPTASAAAQTVTVTDTLDPAKVDVSTFALGPIAFGDRVLSPPGGVTSWTKTVDLRPGKDWLVKVEGALSGTTVTWKFTTLDPQTLANTTDVLAGFLPPSGEGSVGYSVAPKAGIATGTAIAGSASIVFDANAPIVDHGLVEPDRRRGADQCGDARSTAAATA